MILINIKPLSVNKCFQGRRFRTKEYDAYEQELSLLLPSLKIDKSKQIYFQIEVGFSNKKSDIDNFLKPFLDILQKKYGFDDKNIYELQVVKDIVPKGKEYIRFDIGNLNQRV